MSLMRQIDDFTKEELEIILQLLEICKDYLNDIVDNIIKCNIDDSKLIQERISVYMDMLIFLGNFRKRILDIINKKDRV